MSSNKKTHNMQRRAKRLLNGLIVSWSDTNPMRKSEECINGRLNHKNPMLRPHVRKLFNQNAKWIVEQANLAWEIKTTTVFKYPNKRDQHEISQFTFYGKLCDVNETVLEEIKTDMRHGAHYSHTEFVVHCQGDTRPKFTEAA